MLPPKRPFATDCGRCSLVADLPRGPGVPGCDAVTNPHLFPSRKFTSPQTPLTSHRTAIAVGGERKGRLVAKQDGDPIEAAARAAGSRAFAATKSGSIAAIAAAKELARLRSLVDPFIATPESGYQVGGKQ